MPDARLKPRPGDVVTRLVPPRRAEINGRAPSVNFAALKQLLAVPTCTGREEGVVAFVREHLRRRGLARHVTVLTDRSNNLFLRKGGSGPVPCVAAHTDSVQAFRPIEVIERDGVLTGCDRNGRRAGLGADDKAGVFICLELLERCDALAVALFAAEETGCAGAMRAPAAWFEDVGCVIEFDCPAHGLVSYTSGGTRLFANDGSFIRTALPVLQAHGLTRLQRHPYSDVMALRQRFDFSCLNLSCGYHNWHRDDEYVLLDEVEAAIEAGTALIAALGRRAYPFAGATDDSAAPPFPVTDLEVPVGRAVRDAEAAGAQVVAALSETNLKLSSGACPGRLGNAPIEHLPPPRRKTGTKCCGMTVVLTARSRALIGKVAGGVSAGGGVDLLQSRLREEASPVERFGSLHLPGANPVALGAVQAQRHQFEVGDHLVEFGADGARDDVIHAEFVARVRPGLNGGRLPLAHVGHPAGGEAAELAGDVVIAQQGVLRERGGGSGEREDSEQAEQNLFQGGGIEGNAGAKKREWEKNDPCSQEQLSQRERRSFDSAAGPGVSCHVRKSFHISPLRAVLPFAQITSCLPAGSRLLPPDTHGGNP